MSNSNNNKSQRIDKSIKDNVVITQHEEDEEEEENVNTSSAFLVTMLEVILLLEYMYTFIDLLLVEIRNTSVRYKKASTCRILYC